MHELSLCKNILDIVKQQMLDKPDYCLNIIHLEIGELAAIEKSALVFSFDVIKQGTIAENAVLNMVDVEGRGWCEICQINILLHHYYDPCPQCNGHLIKIIAGEELRVKSIEVE